jgi:HEAT repeat protein
MTNANCKMQNETLLALLFTLLAACPAIAASPAVDDNEEARLIAVLRSGGGPAEKDRACWELRGRATARAVPALAPLLLDEQLSHSARCALEAIAGREAYAALADALIKTKGLTKVGIIQSLGSRGDREAVPALAPLVAGDDRQLADAAAFALGRIGGRDAIGALRAVEQPTPAIDDALLRCAELARAAGDTEGAKEVYVYLTKRPATPKHVRVAAYRGAILTVATQRDVPRAAPALLAIALAGTDEAARIAALQLTSQLPGDAVVEEVAEALPGLPPAIQVAAIEGLRQRGSEKAVPALLAAHRSGVPAVRMAALKALGTAGNASAVAPLAAVAAHVEGDEQKAAREALARLHGPGIHEAILDLLSQGKPAIRLELVRAVGARRDAPAAPKLLELAKGPDAALRLAALQSLVTTAGPAAVAELVGLLVGANSDAEREAAEGALATACSRTPHQEALPRVLKALAGADVALRPALLRVTGRIGGAEALRELHVASDDRHDAVRDAAIRTLADICGPEAAPELLRLSAKATNPQHRILALRGYWRVVGLAADRPPAEQLEMCKAGLAAAAQPEEKRLGLAELAKLADPAAMPVALALLDDAAVRSEAAVSVIAIARAIAANDRPQAKAALRQVIDKVADKSVLEEAQAALKGLEEWDKYITAWQLAGPYAREKTGFNVLFDLPFAPETPGALGLVWRPAVIATSGPLGVVDLSAIFGPRTQCVAYARTSIWCEKQQAARLWLGYDDGAKVWLNGKVVYADNRAGGIVPDFGHADLVLRPGENQLLVKITQNDMGWAFCARLTMPDGRSLENVEVRVGAAAVIRPLP